MITAAGMSVFLTNTDVMFGEAYSSTKSVAEIFSTVMPSTSEQNTYGWTGLMPKFRVWTGSRAVHEPAPQTYTLKNLPYEDTYALDRFRMDDDMFGIYYRLLPDMGRQAKRWRDFEIRDLLENAGAYTGTYQNGLDGLTNFNTAHPVDLYDSSKGTYSNDFTGGAQNVTYKTAAGGTTTIAVGGAFSPTGYATLNQYMRTLKGEDNESMGVVPTHLMHHSQLTIEARLVLKASFFAPPAWSSIGSQVGAAENMLRQFEVEPFANDLLTQSGTWYLQDNGKAVRNNIWQLRDAIQIVPKVSETDQNVFDKHQFLWGAWGRAAAGWGPAFLCVRSGP
jgi:phage major head subunit gpT-like protein